MGNHFSSRAQIVETEKKSLKLPKKMLKSLIPFFAVVLTALYFSPASADSQLRLLKRSNANQDDNLMTRIQRNNAIFSRMVRSSPDRYVYNSDGSFEDLQEAFREFLISHQGSYDKRGSAIRLI